MNKRVVSHRIGGGPFVPVVTEYWENNESEWKFISAEEGDAWPVGECYFVEIVHPATTQPDDSGHYGPFFIGLEEV